MMQLTKRCRVATRHVYVTDPKNVVLAVREGTKSAERTAERLSRSRHEQLSVWASNERLHPGQSLSAKEAIFCWQSRLH